MYFVNELDFVCRDGWRSETPVGSPPSKFQDSGYIYFSLYKEVHQNIVLRNRSRRQKGAPHHFSEKIVLQHFCYKHGEKVVIELPACETVYHAHNWIVSRDLYSPDCFRQTNPDVQIFV